MKGQIGIRAHDVAIFDNPEALSSQIKKYGFNCVQFAPRASMASLTDNGRNFTKVQAETVRKAFSTCGVKIEVLGCYVNIVDPDPIKREAAIAQFGHYLELANIVGARRVGTETGTVSPNEYISKNNYLKSSIDLMINQVKKMVHLAETYDTVVGIEPGINHPLHNLDIVTELASQIGSDHFSIILDPTNLVTSESDNLCKIVEEAVERFGQKIAVFHIKDYRIEDDHAVVMPVGKGIADLAATYRTMRRLKPEIPIIWDEVLPEDFDNSLHLIQQLID